MTTRFLVCVILTIFVSTQYEVTAKLPLRIVNGTTAEEGELPYAVQLSDYHGFFICGGSIIASEWILTAGHCIKDLQGYAKVTYGTTQLYDGADPPQTIIVIKNTYRHPNFTHDDNGIPVYDVGILQLSEPIPFSELAQPIQLADDDTDIPVHVDGIFCGWGGTDFLGDLPSYLQKISLQLLTDEECTKAINDYAHQDVFKSSNNLCSNDYYNGGCYGDSGSPYVINGILYGLLSWSYKPCYGIVPNTYTRITNPEYRNWVRNITGV